MNKPEVELLVLEKMVDHLRGLYARITLLDMQNPAAKQRDVEKAKLRLSQEIDRLVARTGAVRTRIAKRMAHGAVEVRAKGVPEHA